MNTDHVWSAPVSRAGLVALGASWPTAALAETILGRADALDDIGMIADASGRVAAGGLLHVLAGALLAVGISAVAAPARRAVTGRIGWWLGMVTAVCLGAFGMLHLLAVEMARPAFDEAAMQEFLTTGLGGAGYWAIPVGVTALIGPFAVSLLLIGLARVGVVSWLSVGLAAAGAGLHLLLGSMDLVEVLSHWILAAGVVLAASDAIRRSGASEESATARHQVLSAT